MKYLFLVLLAYFLFSNPQHISGQTISFDIINKQPTADGNGLVFDVTLASTAPFKLGSGLLYFNYNNTAFGPNVVANGRMTVSYPDGAVLGQVAGFSVYRDFIQNDNTDSRFAFSFQQGLSAGSIPENNITATPAVLFRVTIAYEAGGENLPDDICFESSDVFDDQFFTACGPDGLGFPDCFNSPGVQLTEDNFSCGTAALPVALMDFSATLIGKEVRLNWTTVNEQNNDYFTVERSTDGASFSAIATVNGAGTTGQAQEYESWDDQPRGGLNYYRLKQTDFDGSFTYSEVRVVELPALGTQFSVFPNPVSKVLNVRLGASADRGAIRLLNAAGQVVGEWRITAASDQLRLPVGHLPAGPYWLRVVASGQPYSRKVIVTR
ncbi:MAG: T9SS type A sorting domain-containing protein [Bacteroidota bacterium]